MAKSNQKLTKKEEAKIKREKQKARRSVIEIIVTLLVIAAIIGGIIAIQKIYDSNAEKGTSLRRTVAISSEHYEINNAELSYLFRTVYNDFKDTYSSLLSYYGLDTSTSLKTQLVPTEDDTSSTTWFDYFMSSAASQAQEILLLMEKAYSEGMTVESLDEYDLEEIDVTVNTLKETAEEAGYTEFSKYLRAVYCLGVQEQDIRSLLEKSAVAYKYYNQYVDSLEFTDEEREAYYTDNTDSFIYGKYYSLKLTETVNDEMTTYEKELVYDNLLAKVEEYTAMTLEEFLAVEEAADIVLSDEIDSDDTGEIATWLFEDGRRAGDSKYVRALDTEYTVYFVSEINARREYSTKTARHILFSTDKYDTAELALAEAERVKALYDANPTEDYFAELATEYTDDTGSKREGGLYEDIQRGEMVSEFEDWIYDGTRAAGDCAIIESEDYGAHMMYFVSDGIPAWEAEANDALSTSKVEELGTEMTEAYTINIDVDKVAEIYG